MLKERILGILFDEEITQRELTTRLGSSRSRTSEVLKKLEEEGLIERRRISKRTILVSINHSKTLRVGILRSSEYALVISTLHSLGGRIPFKIRVYDNSLEALKDMMLGLTDMVASPLISGYFFHLTDRNVKPVAGIATGGSGILKRKESGFIGTTPLSKMDKDSRQFKNYTRIYYKSVDDILKAYGNGEIDAAAIWEPFLTMNGGIKNTSESICCCLFVMGEISPAVRLFLEKYVESVERGISAEERVEISRLMSPILGVKEGDVARSLDSYVFTVRVREEDARDQILSFGLPAGKEVSDFLERCPKVSV
jgi:predicted transcriptional regulator